MAKSKPKGSPRPNKQKDVHALVRERLKEGRYLETWHVGLRQGQRSVTSLEVHYVLENGRRAPSRDRYDPLYGDHGWSYGFEGLTIDRRRLRVIVAFDESTNALIVTVVDLDGD